MPLLSPEVAVLVDAIKDTLRLRCLATCLPADDITHWIMGDHIYVLANPLISEIIGIDDKGEIIYGATPNILVEVRADGVLWVRVRRLDLCFRLALDGSNMIDGGNLWANS